MKIRISQLRKIIKEVLEKTITEFQIGDGADLNTEPAGRLPDYGGTKTDLKPDKDSNDAAKIKRGKDAAKQLDAEFSKLETGQEGLHGFEDLDYKDTVIEPGDRHTHTYSLRNRELGQVVKNNQKIQKLMRDVEQAGVKVEKDPTGMKYTLKYPK